MAVPLTDHRVADSGEQIAELRRRVQQMQGVPAGRELATLPGLTALPRLRTGSAYTVDDAGLALALLSGPSQAGEWAGVVGLPDLGYEAAAELGVDLSRVIVVPDPGQHWLSVVAGLAEITGVVLARPGRVSAGQAEKLRSRLRLKGAVLLCLGEWPRAEASFSVLASRWVGVGRGHGHLSGRLAEVGVARPGYAPRRVSLWLPGTDATIAEHVPDTGPDHPDGFGTGEQGRLRLVERAAG